MCGRITQDLNLKMLFVRYRLSAASPALNLKPRYNGCHTQDFVAVRRESEERTLAKLRWGLVPHWATDLKLAARMINARSETVHEKPAFRAAFRRRRCAVQPVETFTVLTTAASPALADIHHRQPAIIEDATLDEWPGPGTSSERVLALAGAANEGPFDTRAVSTRVNSPRNDDAELLAAL